MIDSIVTITNALCNSVILEIALNDINTQLKINNILMINNYL